MAKILAKKDIGKFIKFLKRKYRVFAPVKKGGGVLFSEIDSVNKIITNLSMIPPIKIFYPAIQELFSFKKNKINQSKKLNKPIALLGLNSFDINALSVFDKIMSRPRDKYYWQNRNNSLIIGFGEKRVNLIGEYDLFFQERVGSFQVVIGSHLGKDISKNNLFINVADELKKSIFSPDPLFLNVKKLSSAIVASYNDEIWDDLAKICFGCGNCVYVCPLCYCFDVKDEINLDKNLSVGNCSRCSGKRSRYWDSCFLAHFFEVSGHNFKPKLRDRIYNWYYHKFVRFPEEFGTVGCVSCERCIKYCPAKINYREVLEKILKKYE